MWDILLGVLAVVVAGVVAAAFVLAAYLAKWSGTADPREAVMKRGKAICRP